MFTCRVGRPFFFFRSAAVAEYSGTPSSTKRCRSYFRPFLPPLAVWDDIHCESAPTDMTRSAVACLSGLALRMSAKSRSIHMFPSLAFFAQHSIHCRNSESASNDRGPGKRHRTFSVKVRSLQWAQPWNTDHATRNFSSSEAPGLTRTHSKYGSMV